MGNKLSIGIHYGCTFQTQQWLVVGWLSKINNHELLYYCLFWGGIATLAHTYSIYFIGNFLNWEKNQDFVNEYSGLLFGNLGLGVLGLGELLISWFHKLLILNSKFSQFSNQNENHLPYARHYNPRFVYFLPQFGRPKTVFL